MTDITETERKNLELELHNGFNKTLDIRDEIKALKAVKFVRDEEFLLMIRKEIESREQKERELDIVTDNIREKLKVGRFAVFTNETNKDSNYSRYRELDNSIRRRFGES
jgi:uncharacterized protein YfkK (UPF0435 family)